mmetsp:Transcript_5883/g.10441  ORF Transcript_5883/g.10441 Transcript_5883/m.10441 type:complete len:188 (-) Transcript_5883:412-975(-)
MGIPLGFGTICCGSIGVKRVDRQTCVENRLLDGTEFDKLMKVSNQDSHEPFNTLLLATNKESKQICGVLEVVKMSCPFPRSRKIQVPAAYLANLHVIPNARRKGVASKLIVECEKYTMDSGLNEVFLRVDYTNFNARQFYKRHGFKIVAVQKFSLLHLLPSAKPRTMFLHKVLNEHKNQSSTHPNLN